MRRRPETTYADQLFDYASGRLDANSLRCWIIGRLMLDEGADHDAAEAAFERACSSAHLRAATPSAAGLPGLHFLHRPVRPAPPAGLTAGPTDEGAPR